MASPDAERSRRSVDDAHGKNGVRDSAFHEYPPSMPFIHDDYRRDVRKPIIAYPESNRQGVMSALKNLQDRLKQIEREKKQAELHPSKSPASAKHAAGSSASVTQLADVHDRLLTQEQRCQMLEQQLEHTRAMVHQAERDRAQALRKMAELRADNVHVENAERRNYIEKISDLERDQLRLMATQTLAQNKIKDLEERLEDERHFRVAMQNKLSKSDSTFTTSHAASVEPTKQRRKKKRASPTRSARATPVSARGAVGRKYPGTQKHPGREPPEHYHVNLSEIPFVTGKSTSQSHSLPANFQEVLSLMKSHNPKLCAGPCSHSRVARRGTSLQALRHATSARPCVHSCKDATPTNGTVSESVDELASLILQLEDEFGQLSLEHEDLSRQLKTSSDQQLQTDLSKTLSGLTARMEAKGEQIVKLKRCQDTLLNNSSVKRPKRRSIKSDSCTRVGTTSTEPSALRPSSSRCKAHGSLHLLKDLKKIQSSLRTDDISWDS